MATAVSDEVRTREAEAPPAPGIPAAEGKPATPPKAASTSDAMAGLLATYEKRVAPLEEMRSSLSKKYEVADQEARDATKRAATESAAILKPAVEGVKQAAQYPQPPMPAMAGEPPQPDQKPKPFLEMRSRKEDLQGVIAGLGLIGQMIAARGAPAAGLAAFTGAMKGWAEGDRERADREWRSYLKAVDTIRHQNQDALKMWEVGMKTHHGNVAAQTAYLAAATAEAGMLDRSAMVAQQGAASLAHSIDTVNRELDRVDRHTYQIMNTINMHEMKQIESERQERHFQERREDQREARAEKRADRAAEKKSAQDSVDTLTPQDLTALGQQWFEGKLPPGIARGKAGTLLMPKIIHAGMEWAKSKGIDPETQPQIVAELNGAKIGLNKASGQLAVARGSINSFEKHMDNLVRMSKEYDRPGAPFLARWSNYVKGTYKGDPQTAAYGAAAFEAAQEFAKIGVGTAQGDASTREDARKKINDALNHAQITAVRDTLKDIAHQKIEGFQENIASFSEVIATLGGRTPAKAKAGAKDEKRKAVSPDGTPGMLPSGTDLGKFPGWKWAP